MTPPAGGPPWPDSVPISPDDPDFEWIRQFALNLVEQVRPWLPPDIRIYIENEQTQFVKVTDEAGIWFKYVGGHERLPMGGHVAARWWPTELPTGGQVFCPR